MLSIVNIEISVKNPRRAGNGFESFSQLLLMKTLSPIGQVLH